MEKPVRIGVIGTGFGATVAAPAFTASGCEVIDVVTPRDEAACIELCRRSDVDLVSVHSPPFLHLRHVRAAIEAGHAVLCDKPFGLHADEAAEMLSLADASGVVNLVNFERRYDPAREHVRDLLATGAIGVPNHFQYSRFTALPAPLRFGWLDRRELGGGWLAGQGSHLIDACRWLFGEITDAAAMLRTFIPERLDAEDTVRACDADNGFVATLRTENGVTAVIDCAVESSVTRAEQTAIWGSTGLLEIDGATVTRRTTDGSIETTAVAMGGRTPLLASMERFTAVARDAVRSGSVPPGAPTFADGLACSIVMDRMGR